MTADSITYHQTKSNMLFQFIHFLMLAFANAQQDNDFYTGSHQSDDISSSDKDDNTNSLPSMQCFPASDKPKLTCIKREQLDYKSNQKSKRLPTCLIIGPSKTGTTATVMMLETSSEVSVANKTKIKTAGDFETDFLIRDDYLEHGPFLYSSYFDETEPVKYKVVVGKTPAYSWMPLAPYRAKAFMEESPKFIFTIRNASAADMSLYNHRGWSGRMQMDYDEWLLPRLHTFKEWQSCRQNAYASSLTKDFNGRTDWSTLDDIYDPQKYSWQSAEQIEEYLYKECGFGDTNGNLAPIYHDYLQERLHGQNLRRWAQVFGEQSILCIQHYDLIMNPMETATNIAQFLKIDPRSYSSMKTFFEITGLKSDNFDDYKYSYDRTVNSLYNRASENNVVKALAALDETLRTFTSEKDRAIVTRLCEQ